MPLPASTSQNHCGAIARPRAHWSLAQPTSCSPPTGSRPSAHARSIRCEVHARVCSIRAVIDLAGASTQAPLSAGDARPAEAVAAPTLRSSSGEHGWPRKCRLGRSAYIHTPLYMPTQMYECMYVCMYVCKYVYECMNVCMYVCMHACMHVCMYECVYVCICICVRVCLRTRACVCVYIYTYIFTCI
jgi:hypothetical protein